MSASTKTTRYLRLVSSRPAPAAPVAVAGAAPAIEQIPLPLHLSRLLGFASMDMAAAERLEHIITKIKPRFVFDTRVAPVFLYGNLNRKSVFKMFQDNAVEYYDVAGFLGVSDSRDASLNPHLLIPKIMTTLIPGRGGLTGPVFFFVSRDRLEKRFIRGVADTLPHTENHQWEVSVWGESVPFEPSSALQQNAR